ncbi:hypothetical protein EON64_04240 [archaeon]|nr:MAG: hypothetical protein EON64_04240 [archaeon]
MIKCVRLVRDKETMEGRGFGYVQLSSRQVAAQALGLNSEKFKDKHALRIRKCMDQERQAKDKGSQGSQQHHGHSKFSPSSHPRRLSSQSGGTTSASSSRPSSSTSSSSSVPVSVNAKHALKRLKKKVGSHPHVVNILLIPYLVYFLTVYRLPVRRRNCRARTRTRSPRRTRRSARPSRLCACYLFSLYIPSL